MATTLCVLTPPTGVLAAIEMHRAARAAFQTAPTGPQSEHAFLAMEEMLDALVAMPCRSREEARTLGAYLRGYIGEERHIRDWTQGSEAIALARAADLALIFGHEPEPLPEAVPLSALVARVVHRLSQAGELFACLVLIGGGMAATGLASLIT